MTDYGRIAHRMTTRFLIGQTLGLALFWAALAFVVAAQAGPLAADSAVWAWMITHRTAVLDGFASHFTHLGGAPALFAGGTVAAAWLLFHERSARTALFVMVSTVGSGVLVGLTKNIVDRPRPPEDQWLTDIDGYGFPSGHALGSVAVVGALLIVFVPRLRTRAAQASIASAAAIIVALIGLSRLYLGVHWAFDVLGGWLLAGSWLSFCYVLLLAEPRYTLHPERSPA